MCRRMNAIAVSMNTEYTTTKANKFLNNFVHFFQFDMQREVILRNINSKSICLLNCNVQAFV